MQRGIAGILCALHSKVPCNARTEARIIIIYMGSVPARPKSREPVALHAHAMDNLRFIRETMESAGSFTAVPGVGGILMGSSALAAAFLAGRQAGIDGWLAVWVGEAFVAVLIGAIAASHKARTGKAALLS